MAKLYLMELLLISSFVCFSKADGFSDFFNEFRGTARPHTLSSEGPIVSPPAGQIQGLDGLFCDLFLGIPFAMPPVGALRWQNTQPLSSWQGIRQADSFGPNCATGGLDYVPLSNRSEDCLYLNVFRPKTASPSSKLPVLLFFYGGCFEWGGSSSPIYSGEFLSSLGDAVVVTSNYRLGPFGFLGSAELASATADSSTGNYGLQDQRATMVWLQTNIEAFGGDPDNVLIFGESAGSISVANHIILPRSNGLFRRAIMESGPPALGSNPLAKAQAVFDSISLGVGCNEASDIVSCMKDVDTHTIIKHGGNYTCANDWGPIIDGVELKNTSEWYWEQGQLNDVDAILMGTNANEGTLFSGVPYNMTEEAYESWLSERYGPALGAAVGALYPVSSFGNSSFEAASMIWTDSLMACPTRRAATWAVQANVSHVYLYHLEYAISFLRRNIPHLGVSHMAELPFVFKFIEFLTGSDEEALADDFISWWTGFARTGSPNHEFANITWPLYTPQETNYLAIRLPSEAAYGLKDEVCDFWDRLYEEGCDATSCPCHCPVPNAIRVL